jgi:hypothetical protein
MVNKYAHWIYAFLIVLAGNSYGDRLRGSVIYALIYASIYLFVWWMTKSYRPLSGKASHAIWRVIWVNSLVGGLALLAVLAYLLFVTAMFTFFRFIKL